MTSSCGRSRNVGEESLEVYESVWRRFMEKDESVVGLVQRML